jgi:hypothetical protein
MAVAKKWIDKYVATDTQATIQELLEAVFSMRSVPRLCNKGH